jgi:hypothetical protein
MVLTYDGLKTGVVEIVGHTDATYDETFYLLTGHYYPLVGDGEVDIDDWLEKRFYSRDNLKTRF